MASTMAMLGCVILEVILKDQVYKVIYKISFNWLPVIVIKWGFTFANDKISNESYYDHRLFQDILKIIVYFFNLSHLR